MGKTTFSGPVQSNAGFIATSDRVLAAVTADLTITAATLDTYNGKVIPISKADGAAIVLPPATGSQAVLRFLVTTSITSNSTTISVANASDTMAGWAAVGGSTGSVFSTLPASDRVNMNGSTQGGLAGSYIELTDIAANDWIVSAAMVGSGSPATPFSASVS